MPKQTALNCEYIFNCLYSNIGNSPLAKAKAVSAACLTFAPLVLWQVRQLWQLCATGQAAATDSHSGCLTTDPPAPTPLPFSLSLVWRNLVCLCRGCCRISRTVILIATHLSACATRRMRDLRPSSTRLDWQALRLMAPESVSDLFKATKRRLKRRQSQEFIRNPSHLPQKVCYIKSERRSLPLPLATTGRMSVPLRIKQPFALD